MKHLIFYSLLYFLLCPIIAQGQITISPEVGINYSPYSTDFGGFSSKKANVIFGLSGEIPIHEKWGVYTRFSYNKMEPAQWENCGITTCYNNEYKQSNITLNLKLIYKITPKLNVGLGPSMVKSINSVYKRTPRRPEVSTLEWNYNVNRFGLSGGVSFDFRYVVLHVDYLQILSAHHTIGFFGTPIENNYQLMTTLAVPLRSTKKK